MESKEKNEFVSEQDLPKTETSRGCKSFIDSTNTSMFWTQKEYNLAKQLAADLNDVLISFNPVKNIING